MSGICLQRLANERKAWRINHPYGFFARPLKTKNGTTNLLEWKCGIPGKEGTPWEGGMYRLQMHFTEDYPNIPPRCCFDNVLFHPNIYPSGTVCVSTLNDDWLPANTVKQILCSIQQLLTYPDNNNPVQKAPHDLLKNDADQFWKRVRAEARRFHE